MNQTPSCICSTCLYCIGKVSNAPSKAVVGVDRAMKAPSKCGSGGGEGQGFRTPWKIASYMGFNRE